MAKLTIPDGQYKVLAQIASLPDSHFSELLKGLQEIEPTIAHVDFSSVLVEKVKSISAADIKEILRAISGLYLISDKKDRSPKDIAHDVLDTIEANKPRDFPLEKVVDLVDRLQKLLSIGGLVATASKAVSVMMDLDRILCGTRILSDIRPVFGAGIESVPAAVILHTLNISYHQDGQHKEAYFTMSTNDIQQIKDVLERAEKKTNTLKSFIQKAGIKYLDERK